MILRSCATSGRPWVGDLSLSPHETPVLFTVQHRPASTSNPLTTPPAPRFCSTSSDLIQCPRQIKRAPKKSPPLLVVYRWHSTRSAASSCNGSFRFKTFYLCTSAIQPRL